MSRLVIIFFEKDKVKTFKEWITEPYQLIKKYHILTTNNISNT